MNNPQDRIIKKMIDNIVERNKPEFETKPAEQVAGGSTSSEQATGAAPREDPLLSRKLDYGFESIRRDNAEMRKVLDELKGAIMLIRNDVDSLRMNVQQAMREGPASERHVQQAAPSHAAPQYKQSSADEAWEKNNTPPNEQSENMPKVQQARGFQKKDEGANIDISKVFYYGKK